ncbi:MAG: ABC transporter permease [Kineosporiaceae bacterium]
MSAGVASRPPWRADLRAWALVAPAALTLGALTVAGLGFGAAQSLGLTATVGSPGHDGGGPTLAAYGGLLTGRTPAGREFWASLAFSLWVAGAATLVSAALALVLAVWLTSGPRPAGRATVFGLTVNLAVPHLVWAVALLLLLSQSGILARVGAAAGLVDVPAEVPVLVRDPYGLGIVLHYVGKEVPFLLLVVLAVTRTQGAAYDQVARSLGAGFGHRVRLVTLPLVAPALAAGSLLVFAVVFATYEVPALLGVAHPRALPVLALDLFVDPDLRARPEAMAVSLLMTSVVMTAAVLARVAARRGGPA